MKFDEVMAHFQGVQTNGTGCKALCPAHEDSNPSLDGPQGRGRPDAVEVLCGL